MDEHRDWLHGELNLLCTALLSRGGWGNDWYEPPQKVLLELARACFERDLDVGEHCGEYVSDVLKRAGRPTEEVEEARAHVRDTLTTIHAFLSYEQAPEDYLAWQRSLPLHRACDPMSDPRWQKAPAAWKFTRRTKATAYLCTTKEEWKETFGDLDAWPAYPAMKWCHREDGPALTLYYTEGGTVWEEYWYRFGVPHREGGPQRTIYDRDGTILEERWMENGKLIREVTRPEQ